MLSLLRPSLKNLGWSLIGQSILVTTLWCAVPQRVPHTAFYALKPLGHTNSSKALGFMTLTYNCTSTRCFEERHWYMNIPSIPDNSSAPQESIQAARIYPPYHALYHQDTTQLYVPLVTHQMLSETLNGHEYHFEQIRNTPGEESRDILKGYAVTSHHQGFVVYQQPIYERHIIASSTRFPLGFMEMLVKKLKGHERRFSYTLFDSITELGTGARRLLCNIKPYHGPKIPALGLQSSQSLYEVKLTYFSLIRAPWEEKTPENIEEILLTEQGVIASFTTEMGTVALKGSLERVVFHEILEEPAPPAEDFVEPKAPSKKRKPKN